MDGIDSRLRGAMQALVPCLCAALAGCGGGFYLGIDGSFDNTPPSVSLAAGASSVQAGQSLRVVAAAADDSGIDRVAFYQLDGNTAVLLGSDGRGELTLFARAYDWDGNRADSARVVVTVLP